jgi:hypothetical protein
MKSRRWIAPILLLILIACNFMKPAGSPSAPELTPADHQAAETENAPTQINSASEKPAPTQSIKEQATQLPKAIPTSQTFTTSAGYGFPSLTPMKKASSSAYVPQGDTLPVDLRNIWNAGVIDGLTDMDKQFLSKNGFVVIDTNEQQFKDIRDSVSNQYGQPYYLTTDAAYHALHVTFNDLLEALERQDLSPVMVKLLRATYDQVGLYVESSQGTPLEEDAVLARNYLAVALKLFQPDLELDPLIEDAISAQLAQIKAEAGKGQSTLIPGFEDDYGAYRPVGHYAGNPELENYFRGMTWLGRVNFMFQNAGDSDLKPSRAPLLITLALREAQIDGTPAYTVWANLHEVLDFMVGPSDDPGPVELNALMEQIYNAPIDIHSLADDGKWQDFLASVDSLPAPQINSTFARSSDQMATERSWRFMGQRYTLDGFIFQNLIRDKVEKRDFPSGLDEAAAFGSAEALVALDDSGETQYKNYTQQMQKMQAIVQSQPETEWTNRFYTSWLYAFLPQVSAKDANYPPLMQTTAWAYKEVNSMLGSWAELKHDTVLYTKMPEGLGGGGPPMSGPAPAYVEANPDVFYRLSYAANALADGLENRTKTWESSGWVSPDPGDGSISVGNDISSLRRLAEKLDQFGGFAERERKGQALTSEDYEIIQECLELKECLDHGMYTENAPKPDPIPVISSVSGWGDKVLDAGVGYLDRIYVVVPLEGKLEVAQGGVFSYYEFTQPRSDRLTDEAWREKLSGGNVSSPEWTKQFTFTGGKPVDSLAFRIGDIYLLTPVGYNPPLNMRDAPSKSAAVVRKLSQEDYIEIIEGPKDGPDGRWWKVRLAGYGEENPAEGWVLQNPDWYERSHN